MSTPEYKLGAVMSFYGTTTTPVPGNRVNYRDFYVPGFRGDIRKLETELAVEIDQKSLCVAEVQDIVKARAFTATRRLVLDDPTNSYATYHLRRTPKWYMVAVDTVTYGASVPTVQTRLFASNTKPNPSRTGSVDLVYNTRANFDIADPADQYLASWGCTLHYAGLVKVEGRSKTDLEEAMCDILDRANAETIQDIIKLSNQLRTPITFKGQV